MDSVQRARPGSSRRGQASGHLLCRGRAIVASLEQRNDRRVHRLRPPVPDPRERRSQCLILFRLEVENTTEVPSASREYLNVLNNRVLAAQRLDPFLMPAIEVFAPHTLIST